MKVAVSMIQKGMDNETIAELTEFTQEEIEQLRRQSNKPWFLVMLYINMTVILFNKRARLWRKENEALQCFLKIMGGYKYREHSFFRI
ncbi:hypothetical protein [Aneurinibacillus migulanus]|uniref:hypothetical protein n=1 Tax=Aneurinibacillus migulanus TaxID=47500 RepID=UPI0006B4B64C|nr:hypothetical protein [Aneurinibacillus migulanus]